MNSDNMVYDDMEVSAMGHMCAHPHCIIIIAPKFLACRRHWYQLPFELRSRLWEAYSIGRDINGKINPEYIEVLAQVYKNWRDNP